MQESEDYDFQEYQKLENELLELEEKARKVQFDIIDETDLKPRLHWGENIAVEVYEESIGGEDRSNSIQTIIDHKFLNIKKFKISKKKFLILIKDQVNEKF